MLDRVGGSASAATAVDVLVAPAATEPLRHIGTSREPRTRPHGSRAIKRAVVAVDALAITLSMALAALLGGHSASEFVPYWLVNAVAIPVWLAVFARYKLYKTAAVASQQAEISRILHAVVAATFCTALVVVALARSVSRTWLLLTLIIALVLVIAERAIVRHYFRRARLDGRLKRRVVVIGTNAEALAVVQMLQKDKDLGYEVVGLLAHGSEKVVASVPMLGKVSEALDVLPALDATGVIIATSAVDVADTNRLARDLMELGFHVEFTSGLVDIASSRLIVRPLGRRPMMYIEPVRRLGWRAVAKRTFDVVTASIGLVLAAPVLLAAVIAIKRDSPGPVIFAQRRVGKDGEIFDVKKLRTMVVDAEQMLEVLRDKNDADGPLFKMHDDPRVTRVGRFLRASSIDELPQLWNVLRGEMSIVGPRPAIPSELVGWSDELRNRLRVQPGITGMWQVNGRSESSFDDYVRHDLYYVDNWSLLTDLGIVAKTFPAVLSRRGAS